MDDDTLALGALAVIGGLALVGVVVLALAGQPVPAVLEHTVGAALTGLAILVRPGRQQPQPPGKAQQGN